MRRSISDDPQRHDGNVIGLRRRVSKGAHFFEQAPADVGRRETGKSARVSEETFVAVAFFLWTERFSNSIRVEDQGVARAKLQLDTLERQAHLQAEGCPKLL